MFPQTILVAFTAVSGVSALVARGVCNADNCLRALRAQSPKTRLAQAQADCAAWLTVTSTPIETATAYTTVADLTSTLVEEIDTTQTVYDTFTSTAYVTPTETVYTSTTTLTVDPAAVVVVTKRAAATSPTIPAYASPCSGAVRFSSACSCIGVSGAATAMAPASTTTVTIPTTALTTTTTTSIVTTHVSVVYDTTTVVALTAPTTFVSTVTTETVTKASQPAEPTNELANSGFEDETSIAPWVRFGSANAISSDTSMPRSGSRSGLLTITSQNVGGFHQRVTIEADKNYRFSIWVRQNTLACNILYAGCSTSPSNFFTLFTKTGTAALGTWVELGGVCKWGADRVPTAGISVFNPSGCTPGGKIYFDDASLVEL